MNLNPIIDSIYFKAKYFLKFDYYKN
jgi:hypothetical protein